MYATPEPKLETVNPTPKPRCNAHEWDSIAEVPQGSSMVV